MSTNSEKLDALTIPVRAKVSLKARGIETVDQLIELTYAELLQIPNLGRKTAERVLDVLKDSGHQLRKSSVGASNPMPSSTGSTNRIDQISPANNVEDGTTSLEITCVFPVDAQTDNHQISQQALRIQVESINEFVAQVFTQPNRLSDLLASALLSDSQMATLRHNHLPVLLREVSKIWLAYLHEVLPTNHAEVLKRRFFNSGQGPDTLAEIGTTMNLSRERIRQIQQKGIGRLRSTKRRQELIDRALYVSDVLLSTSSQEKNG